MVVMKVRDQDSIGRVELLYADGRPMAEGPDTPAQERIGDEAGPRHLDQDGRVPPKGDISLCVRLRSH